MRLKGNKYSRHKVSEHTSDVDVPIILPDRKLLEKAANILNSREKVVILAGQGALAAGDEIIAVAERLGAPVVKALLGKAAIPDDHPMSLGGLGLLGTEPAVDAMNEADTLFMIGTSFPYTDYLPKLGQAKGIQIDIKPDKIGIRYPVDVGLVGDSKATLSALLPILRQKNDVEFLKSMQQEMKEWNTLLKERSTRNEKPIKPQVIASLVSDELEDNAVISVDSGTITTWAAQYIKTRKGMKFSVSGTLASMACGLPYAIAAQVAFPDRQCVAFVGDGGFTMLMGEFATAVQYRLPIKVFVIKNNTLGMIRWEQMAFLGNPEYGVEFSPISYSKFAEACGGKGYYIREPDEAKSLVHFAMKEKRPTLVEVEVDPFEPPMPPKTDIEFAANLAKSFARGQPYTSRIGLTLFRDKVHEGLKSIHNHDDTVT
jgi:pyruvate dehydrogenase (quinone)/pyruvate oxidase